MVVVVVVSKKTGVGHLRNEGKDVFFRNRTIFKISSAALFSAREALNK